MSFIIVLIYINFFIFGILEDNSNVFTLKQYFEYSNYKMVKFNIVVVILYLVLNLSSCF